MEHKNIPNDGLHEPKDIVFASPGQVYVSDGNGSGEWKFLPPAGIDTALAGQVFVANGSGGGAWSNLPGGWGLYDDSGSPITLGPAPVELTIDGDGPRTNTTQLPGGRDLWNEDSFMPHSLNDVYGIELEFEITASTGANVVRVDMAGLKEEFPAQASSIVVRSMLHTFDAENHEIVMTTDTGAVQVTGRRLKIVQLYGAT